jgi:hypothetical protein
MDYFDENVITKTLGNLLPNNYPLLKAVFKDEFNMYDLKLVSKYGELPDNIDYTKVIKLRINGKINCLLLPQLINLRELIIDKMSLGNIECIEYMHSLTYLEMPYYNDDISPICRLNNLETLLLPNLTTRIKDFCIFPKLKKLDITKYPYEMDIIKYLRELKELYVSFYQTDISIIDKCAHNIEVLSINLIMCPFESLNIFTNVVVLSIGNEQRHCTLQNIDSLKNLKKIRTLKLYRYSGTLDGLVDMDYLKLYKYNGNIRRLTEIKITLLKLSHMSFSYEALSTFNTKNIELHECYIYNSMYDILPNTIQYTKSLILDNIDKHIIEKSKGYISNEFDYN